MSMLDFSVLNAFDVLQCKYIAALDHQKMKDWLETFSKEDSTSYICTTAENSEGGFELAWILDDCRARLEDRVTFVTKIWAGTYSAHRTRHLCQRTSWKALDENRLEFESNFLVTYTATDLRQTEVFATGVYRDIVSHDETGEMKFLKKEVIVDTHILHRYLVFPL